MSDVQKRAEDVIGEARATVQRVTKKVRPRRRCQEVDGARRLPAKKTAAKKAPAKKSAAKKAPAKKTAAKKA